jgi:uracil-DNA glycosylase family 4
MSKRQKREELEALQQEILAAIPNPWLFPSRGKVQGFLGAGSVMFVAERPSTGGFGGTADHLLYSLLEKHGAADGHITDVIKTRGKVGDPYPEDISAHRRIFNREVEIVQPRLIVAFGPKVRDLLLFTLAGAIPIRCVWHYSYTRRGPDKPAAFEEQIRRALGLPPST